MADVAPVTPAATRPAATATAAEAATEAKGGKLTADFDTFLKLLTTQMKAQDPLQPIESTEFVAQLAQFSTVEQQVQTNDRLAEIIEALSATNTSQLASWLGREVRAPAKAPFDGAPIAAYPPTPPAEAASATLIVLNEKDETVAEIPFTPGAASVSWNGDKAGGGKAPEGLYRFEARYATKTGDTTKSPADVYGRVVEARREDGKAILTLEGGATVDADEVSGVRVAPAAPVADPVA